MILILVPAITSRIKYTFNLLFTDILKTTFEFTTEIEKYKEYKGTKFSYGKKENDNTLHFQAVDLLFDNTIVRQNIEIFNKDAEPCFFKVTGGALVFDPFACAFYLVSRYEEYLPHTKDNHGRFPAEESIAFKGGFLERPMVNVWAKLIKTKILEPFPDTYFPPLSYSFFPTIDIDNAYAFKYKGSIRAILSLFLLLFTFDFQKLKKRLMVHLNFLPDPYESYEKQRKIHERYNLKPLYFILLGDYGRYDKNLSYNNEQYRSLIKGLESGAEVCLHPSYASTKIAGQIEVEKKRLEEIINRNVYKSRQHFIKINFPDTYRRLAKASFTDDYSMGFPDRVGYRASIASNFKFFDLEENKQTELTIHPFVAMDVTLKKYMHIRAKDVIGYLNPIVDECRKLGGDFTIIFHNESIGGERVWKNWSDVYEKLIKVYQNRIHAEVY